MAVPVAGGGLQARRWTVLGTTAFGVFMPPFDASVVSVALPKLAPALQLDLVGALWVQTSYLLALTVSLIPAGRLADRWGRLRIYRAGAVLFALASVAAATAQSAPWLIGARVVQGAAGAFVSATATALVSAAFPRHQRGRAIGLNVTAIYLGLAAGPPVGGLLTDQLGWRSIFFVNLPIAAVTLGWGLRLEPDRGSGSGRVDWLGAGLLMVTLASGIVGVTLAPIWGWTSARALALLGAAAAGLVAFALFEAHRRDPILPLRLFRRSRLFAAASLAALANYTAFYGVIVLTALFLEVVSGRGAQEAGLLIIAEPLMMTTLSAASGRLSDSIGSRWLTTGGMLGVAAGMLLLSRLPATPGALEVVGPLAVVGLGMAAFSSPNTSAVMGAVEPADLGVASGTIATMRFLGQALSVAILGSLATSRIGSDAQGLLFTGRHAGAAAGYHAGYHLAMVVGAGVALAGACASLARERRSTAR